MAMNVTDEDAVDKGVADVIAKYGKIDILGQQCRHSDRQAAGGFSVLRLEEAAVHPSRRRVPSPPRPASIHV